MLSVERIETLIGPILKYALTPYGFREVSFSSSVDHDGDNIIVASIDYRPSAPPINIIIFLDAVNAAMRRLSEEGDQRFLHVRHIHADGQPSEEHFSSRRMRRRQGTAS